MRIIIPGNPIANARHRCRCLGKHPSAYDPQFELKKKLKLELSNILEGLICHCMVSHEELDDFNRLPISLTLTFLVPINSSDSRSVKSLKSWGVILPDVKPDYDNLAKLYGDVANGILWHDDSQIVEAHIYEKYSENPCTIIDVKVIKMNLNEDAIRMVNIFSPSALEKFESDISILAVELETMRLCRKEDREDYMENAAKSLKNFCTTYSVSIKKMISKDSK